MRKINTVLVTRGAGFIGSAVVRQFINEMDITVVNVDALTYVGNLESLASVSKGPRYHFEHANICDKWELRGRTDRRRQFLSAKTEREKDSEPNGTKLRVFSNEKKAHQKTQNGIICYAKSYAIIPKFSSSYAPPKAPLSPTVNGR